jgi:hypothetical protein
MAKRDGRARPAPTDAGEQWIGCGGMVAPHRTTLATAIKIGSTIMKKQNPQYQVIICTIIIKYIICILVL